MFLICSIRRHARTMSKNQGSRRGSSCRRPSFRENLHHPGQFRPAPSGQCVRPACGRAPSRWRGLKKSRRSVSRVLSTPCGAGRPFLWDAPYGAPRATNPGGGSKTFPRSRLATKRRPPLFGLAPGGVYPASPVTRAAVRSYRPVSPLPATRHRRFVFCGTVPGVAPAGR